MRRYKVLLLIALFCTLPALMGAIVLDRTAKRYGTVVASDTAVAGVTTVYSEIVPIGGMQSLGFWMRTASAGSPDLSIYAEYSPTRTAGDFGQAEGGSKIIDITDTNIHTDMMLLVNNNYLRLKIVGNAGNPADTTIDIVVNKAYGDR